MISPRLRLRTMYYTYELKSEKNGQFYTGSTTDLRKRLSAQDTRASVVSQKLLP
jgi:predicted GIY-YIG superfamily endonuclease